MQKTWVQTLGWEYPLEKEMATHSSILAWEFPETEEPGGLQSMELQRVRHDLVTEHVCIYRISCHLYIMIILPLSFQLG